MHDPYGGLRLYPNAERYLKTIPGDAAAFQRYPEAIAGRRGAETCQFNLDSLRYEYPEEIISGKNAAGGTDLAELGRARQLRGIILTGSRATIEYELKFIREMNYASLFPDGV